MFSSLGLDKAEWLEDIRKGSCSLKSLLGVAGEGIDERESSKFEEGLNSKVKLSLYRTFSKIVEFKKYVRGVGDAGINSGQERMDSMKSWAGIEDGKAGRSVCCVMQSVRVSVMCCGIVLVNPRRACAARVTVLALCVCLCLCVYLSVTALAATAFF